MFENENNGVHPNHNGNGSEAPASARKKRVLTKDLSARIEELEKKLEAATAGQARLAHLSEQLAKLDERVNKIALSVAQQNLVRGVS
ncbi:MAG TPA: hypothetical protein VMT64_16345 [Candidatus Binataceae bacterium]|nr:hypothetical protein [Candidatus Binataceae bacterium]